MGGYLNKIGLHGNPFDTDVRVLKEPRTVPYNRIGSLERIRTVSVPYRTVSREPPPEDEVDAVARELRKRHQQCTQINEETA